MDDFNRNGGVVASIWIVTLSIGIVGCCVVMALPLAHIVSHKTEIGHSEGRAAEVLTLALLVAGVTRLTMMGYVSDRLGSLPPLFLFSCFQTSMPVVPGFVDNLIGLFLIEFIFGIGYGIILPLYPVVIRDHLFSVGIGRRIAVVIFFGGMGMALGGWFGGFLFAFSGSYVLAFLLVAVANTINLMFVGMLLLWLWSVRATLIETQANKLRKVRNV